eukprot:5639491-Pyramimonas_sp.AAC.1
MVSFLDQLAPNTEGELPVLVEGPRENLDEGVDLFPKRGVNGRGFENVAPVVTQSSSRALGVRARGTRIIVNDG